MRAHRVMRSDSTRDDFCGYVSNLGVVCMVTVLDFRGSINDNSGIRRRQRYAEPEGY